MGIKGIAKGLGTTLRMLLRPKVTIDYPNKKRPRAYRFRGKHELRRYDNGLEMCVGCELCQVACPANAIVVFGAENDPNNPNSPGERYAYDYQINMLRCIFCGLCEEACPTGALHLTQEFELAAPTRAAHIYKRDRLVVKGPGADPVPPAVYGNFSGHGYTFNPHDDAGSPVLAENAGSSHSSHKEGKAS